MNNIQSYSLKIGECIFNIANPEGMPLRLQRSIEPFQIAYAEEPDVTIEVVPGYPQMEGKIKPMTNVRNLPELSDNMQAYYRYTLNRYGDDFLIISGNENDPSQTKRYAISNRHFRKWKVYLPSENEEDFHYPLNFPLGSLIFYYSIISVKGLLLPAMGLNYYGRGYVFTGFSGIERTTISNLWLNRGGVLISDDQLVLMQDEKNFNMYNSPMAYTHKVMKSPLHAIYILRQADKNESEKLSETSAFSRLMNICIHHDKDELLVNNLMDSLHHLLEHIPVYELNFKPDDSVINYVLETNY